jgi:DNA-binding response OmpR family regulator
LTLAGAEPAARPGEDAPVAADPRGRVLLAEHEPEVAEMSRRYLERAGLAVRVARTPAEAVRAFSDVPPPVVVLDLTMPGLDVRRVRRALAIDAAVPVVFLADSHRVPPRGLGTAGPAGRPWIARPFSPRDLVTAVTGLLRPAAAPAELAAGRLALDSARRVVLAGGTAIPLTRTEVALLAAFMDSAGRVLTRERLLAVLLSARGKTPGTRSIDVYVGQLRAKLGGDAIRTVRNVGYVLDVREPAR